MKKGLDMKLLLNLLLGLTILGAGECKGKWYDYGNGIINLEQVHHINPYITNRIGISEEYTQNEFNEKIQYYKDNNYTNISISLTSLIKFDDFTLTLESNNFTEYKDYENFVSQHNKQYEDLIDFVSGSDCYHRLQGSI